MKLDHDTLNAMLPDAPEAFVQSTLRTVKNLPESRKTPPRRMTAAIVLAAILTLLSVGALAAALLRGKEFAQKVVAPKAAESESDRFTAGEVEAIIAMAGENGVELPEVLLSKLRDGSGYYKEELLRAVLKTELGFYPGQWPIEEQYWYGELLVFCGVSEENTMCLPEHGEITQERADAIARAQIFERFAETADLTDIAVYARSMTFAREGEARLWRIEYEAKDTAHNDYYVELQPDGAVMEARITTPAVSDEATVFAVRERYLTAYPDHYGTRSRWTEEILVAFGRDLKAAAAREGHTTEVQRMRSVLGQAYALPGDTAVSRAQAYDLAVAAAGAQNWDIFAGYTFYLPSDTAAYWKTTLISRDHGTVHVEVNAQTGEMGPVCTDADGKGSSWRDIVLEENLFADIDFSAPGDLTRTTEMTYEEAKALADGALRTLCAGLLSEEEIAALLAEGHIEEIGGRRAWYFAYYREAFGPEQSDAYVYFDAVTGQMMGAMYVPAEMNNG